VWDSFATDSAGTFTCGGRINWLKTVQGYDEASACAKVSDEFIDGPCGPVCDPSKCDPPTLEPTQHPSPTPVATFCGCDSCTQEVWDSFATDSAGTFTCGGRINWLKTVQGYDEASACTKVSDEFVDGPCGSVCNPLKCMLPPPLPPSSPTTSPTQRRTPIPSKNPTAGPSQVPSKSPSQTPSRKLTSNPTPVPSKGSTLAPTIAPNPDQKCGGAVDFTNDPKQACETYLWGPTGDNTMHCFAYGGRGDPCHLNNNNDLFDGIFKDPSQCLGNTFYLWDEPDTQGRDYSWAGSTWLDYSRRFAQELEQFRAFGGKITGPLLKAGNSGVIKENMQTFFDACGMACFDPTDPAYIDIIAINGFCGPWNEAAGGCRSGAKFIYEEAVSVSRAFGNLPVYITNWSRLQTSDVLDQVDAIDSIDEFFPASGVVQRVYWFGARDFGGGAGTTSYLNNILQDGRSLGDIWRTKCDSI